MFGDVGSGVKLLNSGINPYPYGSQEASVPFGLNLDAWRAIGDVKLSIDLMNPLRRATGSPESGCWEQRDWGSWLPKRR